MYETRLAGPDEIRTAIRLVVASHRAAPADELEAQVDVLVEWMSGSEAPPRHAHVLVLSDRRPVSACLCFDTAGKVGMLFLPHVSTSATLDGEVGKALLGVIETATQRGLNFVQVVCEPSQQAERRLLTAVGFRQLAVLDYLEREVGARPPSARGPEQIEWRSYVHADPGRFASMITETYRGSLDCPRLTGLRTIDDVLASHRATGDYMPEHWYLAEICGEPAGVLILAGAPMRSAIEIAYMGVSPSHRGRGVGLAMLHKALSVARARRVEMLTLAVDAANTPAVRIYDHFGFMRVATREAWYHALHRQGVVTGTTSGVLSTSVQADGS